MRKIMLVEDRFFSEALAALRETFDILLATCLYEALAIIRSGEAIEGAIVDSELPVTPGGGPVDGAGSLIIAVLRAIGVPALSFQGHGGSNYWLVTSCPYKPDIIGKLRGLPLESAAGFGQGMVREFIEDRPPEKLLRYIARLGKTPETAAEQALRELDLIDWTCEIRSLKQDKDDPESWRLAGELLKQAAISGSIEKEESR